VIPGTVTAASLAVDVEAAAGTTSNLNRVLEPGERALLKPAWRNDTAAPIAPFSGVASNPTGPAGATYALPDAAASYAGIAPAAVGDCGADCYQFSVSNPATRPAVHWDAGFDEALTTPQNRTRPLHIGGSFTDVPMANIYYRFIETIFHKSVTSGTGPGVFSPNASTTREQMAVFLLVSKEGAGYVPLPCTVPIFADVPCVSIYARWINELSNRGITSGCGGGNYCPTDSVTREQMAVFLLTTQGGIGYVPPPCTTQIFNDVPCSSIYARWINELFNRGIAAGCGGNNYCPLDPVTRGQMAVFLTTTFSLALYGP
jgi:hypothetical protein